MKRGILLALLCFLCMGIPVQANTLAGDGSGTVIGSTSVTARVEMPEEESSEEPDEDINTDSDAVKTGDETQILQMIVLMGICSMIIVLIGKTKE